MQDSTHKHTLIHVYTGNGKGKTTAAWGQALRAVGCGWRVAVVEFMKPAKSGERIAAEPLSPELAVFGQTRPYDVCQDQRESPVLREDNRRNFETAREIILSGDWDMVVLDEINIVLHYEHVSRDEILRLLRERPQDAELILTGRYAPDWLIDEADLVTEMTEVKHPCAHGIGARKGIEY